MLGEAGQSRVANAGFGPLSGGPKADFERDFPDWSPDEIFPAGSSYVVLAWDRGSAVLRASGLVRSVADGRWHELVANQCPAPAGEGVAAAVLGPPGCTVVFGSVGRELRGDLTVRLSYDGRAGPDPDSLSRPDLSLPAGGASRAGGTGAGPRWPEFRLLETVNATKARRRQNAWRLASSLVLFQLHPKHTADYRRISLPL